MEANVTGAEDRKFVKLSVEAAIRMLDRAPELQAVLQPSQETRIPGVAAVPEVGGVEVRHHAHRLLKARAGKVDELPRPIGAVATARRGADRRAVDQAEHPRRLLENQPAIGLSGSGAITQGSAPEASGVEACRGSPGTGRTVPPRSSPRRPCRACHYGLLSSRNRGASLQAWL